ncbi:hypothetical protein [Oceanospirillum beijerinckii]|uniref:hypothetical protein n=1 Tax=Oceanospirillum beijerinckii TaxID=64976 RepID=UPI0003FCB45D|nr:hypothetical protein [Oceanospirillum beijerinckii]
MSTKEDYQKKIEAQLHEWKTDIEQLKAKADAANSSVNKELYEQVDELKAKRDKLSSEIDQLKQSSGDAWHDMKSGVELARESLSIAIKSASERFD